MAAPFNSIPFNGLRRRTTKKYSFLDAFGSWLESTTDRRIPFAEYPQGILLGDCARWRLITQTRAGDISGSPLKATLTTIEIDSRSLIKKSAWQIDMDIMNAIDRQVFTTKGHRISGILHEELTTSKELINTTQWVYTYTSRYVIGHYL